MRHGEPPVFYSLGNERVVARSTRPSSRNNNLSKHKGAVEGMHAAAGSVVGAPTYSINSWRATENPAPVESFNDLTQAASDDLFGGAPEQFINY